MTSGADRTTTDGYVMFDWRRQLPRFLEHHEDEIAQLKKTKFVWNGNRWVWDKGHVRCVLEEWAMDWINEQDPQGYDSMAEPDSDSDWEQCDTNPDENENEDELRRTFEVGTGPGPDLETEQQKDDAVQAMVSYIMKHPYIRSNPHILKDLEMDA